MSTSQIIFLLLFLSAWTISCFPSKPLNERSTQLTWQAWLLIDESQNKQDNPLRRRITPKSVFIAPTFSPEALPECSEGYQSDSMGRCIKIIMLNKELHLDFLLQQLNQKFGGMDDYEDEDETTSGPVNINIPLNAEINEETEVAIVVAPTNNILQGEAEGKLNTTLSEEKMNAEDIAGILGVKQIGEVETTTITTTPYVESESTTLESTTKNIEITTIDDGVSKFNALFFLDPKRQVEVKTELYDDTTTAFTTTEAETTETETTQSRTTEINTEIPLYQMDQALPYSDTSVTFIDTKREAVESSEAPTESTTFSIKQTTIMPENKFNSLRHQVPPSEIIPVSFKKVEEPTTTTGRPNLQTPIDNTLSNQDPSESTTKSIFSHGFKKPDFQTLYNENNLKFLTQFGMSNSTEKHNTKKNIQTTLATTTLEEDTTIIPTTVAVPVSTIQARKQRFPVGAAQPLYPAEGQTDDPLIAKHLETARYFSELFNKYAHTRGADLAGNQKHVFKTSPNAPPNDQSQDIYHRYKAHRENHRNREKSSEWFHLPPKWTDTSQKPVVLRFSRKHGHIDSQQLRGNNFYREIDPRLFGFPQKDKDIYR